MENQSRVKDSGTVVVLMSGGIDSTACVDFYIQKGWVVSGLFVDYGQVPRERELSAARTIAEFYGVGLSSLHLKPAESKCPGEVVGRNAFLLLTALLELSPFTGILAIGIHEGTRYYDCGPTFVNSVQELLDGYTEGRVQIGAPFLQWSKPDIWEYCRVRSVPVHLTYSCEAGAAEPCGQCRSCHDLRALNAR